MKPFIHIALLTGLMVSNCVYAQEFRQPGRGGARDRLDHYLSEVSAHLGSVVLGRPSDRSVTANVLMTTMSVRAVIQYGVAGQQPRRSSTFEIRPGQPQEVVLDGLLPNCAYDYRVIDPSTQAPLLPEHGPGTFHTQRPCGSAFQFTVQADSHLDGNSAGDVYLQTLNNIVAEKPDFHIDLGDTFMTGKIQDRAASLKQYVAQRYYLGQVGSLTPVFLAIGNHDGEEMGRGRRGESLELATWSCMQRKRFFPNPEPDFFYSGDAHQAPGVGSLQDYYAWEWGDALFIVLSPYWYSDRTGGGKEPWNMTLGKQQYDWLSATLRRSNANFKFVFIHQLLGGLDTSGRGGAEAVPLYEWGGHEKDGRDTFAQNRPGWEKPIHNLLVQTGVTIVFHGHDHFFARQAKDGIVYQLVPQPGNPNARKDQAAEYGYKQGDFLPNSGHLLVHVQPDQTDVAYIRTVTPAMRLGVVNGIASFSYNCTRTTAMRNVTR